MKHYFGQIAPKMDWRKAKEKRWRSVDVFGKEGSRKKEVGIKKRILS
ncbi:MAG: hypothetical protein KG012_13110 [Deltaproteobacteria bacterium]|jgi:hypothetical protein|nr:hypothetical protein [Deltaproteobacteria bacterium]